MEVHVFEIGLRGLEPFRLRLTEDVHEAPPAMVALLSVTLTALELTVAAPHEPLVDVLGEAARCRRLSVRTTPT